MTDLMVPTIEGSACAVTPAETSLGRPYWRLWTAATVSLLGDGVDAAAFPLLAALVTHRPLLVAGAHAARGVPWLCLGPFGGVLADRRDRRAVMALVNLARAAVVAGLAVAIFAGLTSIAWVWGAALLLGIGEVLFDPAAQAILPSLVPAGLLERANGRLLASESGAKELVGPAVGGALFAAAAWCPFAIDAASFVIAALVIAGLRGSHRPSVSAPAGVKASLAGGWRFLRGERVLLGLAGATALLNLGAGAVEATMVVFAHDRLHLGAATYGLLLAAFAVTGLTASVLADRILGRVPAGISFVLGAAVTGTATIAAGLTTTAWVFGVLIGVVFGCVVLGSVFAASLRGELVPDELRGRVAALSRTIACAAWPVGALVGGIVAERIGLRAPFFVDGGLALVAAAVAMATVNPRSIGSARVARTGGEA